MGRRIYRSVAFWLALNVLVFLGWAWWRSMQGGRGYGVMWNRPGLSIFLSHGASWLKVGIDDASLKSQRGFEWWDWGLEEIEDRSWFPGPKFEWRAENRRTAMIVPHWLMIGLYLGAWWSGVWWWRRRVARTRAGGPEASDR